MKKVTEIWKDIPGYEGYYQASTLGRIKSLKRVITFGVDYCACYVKQERLMTLTPSPKGYYYVCFTVNGKVRSFSVHRLIAKAHIQNPDKKMEVNHKNGVKADNSVENLEWMTQTENARHSWTVLKRVHISKVDKPVIEVSLDGFLKNTFKSRTEASKSLGVGVPAITNAINRHSIFLKNSYLY